MAENVLAQAASPYLRQHAENPVHWQTWSEAALGHAQQQNKPILLSIGYAACHWCHVMAHESFEDDDIAALMNEHFINIKVDREERPDLDTIYQHALALLGEQGGWPLTMFLTPKGEPFWGGTYFPPTPRYGRPGFPQILQRVAEIYAREPDKIQQNAKALIAGLAGISEARSGDGISLNATTQIAGRLVQEVDRVYGGIGGAPKFPQPSILELFWRAWLRTGERAFRDAVTLTLDRMCQGGIYDHLGGGFARYATDPAWLVPHFEKMLYDNAQLIDLLTLVWQDTREPVYEMRVRESIAWLLREMRVEGGGFAGTLDADSEGQEGKFYVWRAEEIDALLGDDADLFKSAYDVTPLGNWEGKTILNRSARPALLSDEDEARLAACRAKLLAARANRIRPGRDDKVLVDWNGLIISALARAAQVFDLPEASAAAREAFAFVRERMTETTGGTARVRHSWCAGRAEHPATLDDYANMCRAALVLYENGGDASYLDQVKSWLAVLDTHYLDPDTGSYYFSADDVTDVIARTRTVADNATPAGNGTIAAVFARLFYLTGDASWRDRADRIVLAFSGELQRNIFPLATLLNANELLQNAVQVAVIGERGAADTTSLLAAVGQSSVPDLVLTVVPPGTELPALHPAHGKTPKDGLATAYVCRGTTCSLPLTEPAEIAAELRSR
ncbi:MAG: thioredoxin domain-containing protein [Alphaproteobacteria bacterium]|nr:thioredoxin domain-containing protein [Alphaproteobacteria bacterium]